jgi:acyl-CoA synthetase (NDP forming)
VLNQPEAVRTLDTRRGKVPAYAYPEAAARALARAARYAEWRGTPHPAPPALPDVDVERGRELVHAFLAGRPDGALLPPAEAAALLRHYGLRLAAAAEPRSGGEAVAIGVTDDQMFGPLVMLSAAGPAAEPPVGAARLAPLTSVDADMLISSIRSGRPLPAGQDASQAAVDATLRDVLLRVSRLTDDLPEITELELNPVIARPDGAIVADVRIRVAPQLAQDPFLRRLR